MNQRQINILSAKHSREIFQSDQYQSTRGLKALVYQNIQPDKCMFFEYQPTFFLSAKQVTKAKEFNTISEPILLA